MCTSLTRCCHTLAMSPGTPDEPAEGLIEAILQRGEPTTVTPDDDASELLTFLFADIRGYTTFTQQRGDQAAAKLVARFAQVVREFVSRFGGTVLELRGDEALCVFASPRQSLRLAVALQQRFVEETAADADLPLAVGIGIDAGEAVRAQDGYRGGALNLAARLCARAKAGEVLASPEVTHLARSIDGVRYVVVDRVSLKGLSDPIRPVRVLPEGEDPAQQMVALLRASTGSAAGARAVRWLPGPLAKRPRTTTAGAIGVAALVAGTLVAVAARRSDHQALTALSENSLGILDPHTRHLDSQVGVEAGPIAAAAGFGSVWTANSEAGSVSRVDIAGHRVRTIPVGSAPSAIAVGPDSVWVTNSGDGTVSRIDPATNRTQQIDVGSTPGGVASARRWVWVTNTGDGTVDRIDPSTNEVVETIDVGASPSGIGAGRDIWVANSSSNSVTKIDGDTHRVVATIPVGQDPKGVAVVGRTVWVTNNLGGNVTRIATSGTSPGDTVPVGPQPAQIAAVDGHVWIASQATGSVAEIDPASPLVHTVRVGPIPGGIAAVDGKLWVATTMDPARHRGGTLRIVGEDVSIDPTYVSKIAQAELLSQVYDGLVGFRHAAGADGTTIVADLASEIPEPVDGGRTYVFHLRTGIRWSTGRPLTVDDIRRGLERSIANPQTLFGEGIVGAGNCSLRRCTVSGIAVDARAHTVTIILVRPDGNFIDDLAFVVAAPAATPLPETKTVPIAGTGPYHIERDVPGQRVVLTRNRYFHEWAAAAQPAGYPDTIDWRIDPTDPRKHGVRDVAAGRADWADVRNAALVGTLAARFPGRLLVSPAETVHGLMLNTRIPPFSDVRVRKALGYAINRRGVAAAWFTPAVVTCQFIPPNLPGHRSNCPYTLQPAVRGTWGEPDFPKAQALVAASKYRGTSVTVWTMSAESAGLAQVVAVLNQLGFHARLSVVDPDKDYFGFVSDTRNKVQASFDGYIANDASPASSLESFGCAAFLPKNPNNANAAGFCDPSIDRLMSQARSVERSSPATANALWAQVDRRLVDAAPWIPLVTPSWIDALSTRAHNYKRSLVLGVLFDQMWLR